VQFVRPEENVPLAPLSTLGVGGAARWFCRVTDAGDLAEAERWSHARQMPVFVLGGGSNIVVSDEGFDGLVVQMALSGVAMTPEGDGTLVTAAAGEPWDPLVQRTVECGLAGLECLSGIPGSVGGTPIQNVGAYGQEVADTISRVEAYDRVCGEVVHLRPNECGFSYRMSRFKGEADGRFVVSQVSFRLRPGAPAPKYPDLLHELARMGVETPSLADVRAAVLAVDPDTRSVGSFFMNPIVSRPDREHVSAAAGIMVPGFETPDGRVKLPAAWLIERAGFQRGQADGPAGISSKHTLALVNRGGATARDVLRLAARIKRQVAERFGVALRPEPVFVGFDGDPDVEYLRTTTI
jgi:UDP-N-acetylmuramate dehydrogenase